MSLKLYFIRHGETQHNQKGNYCGALDPELTAEGIKMAEQFAAAYKSLPWVGAFVSPMKRTIATAKPLCDAVGLEMQIREGLKEIDYGKWEGKSPEEINQEDGDLYLRWLSYPAWNAPKDGERGVDVSRRSSLVIQEIQDRYQNGNVLVVSHKTTIRIMLCNLLGIDLERYRDRIAMPLGGVSIIEMRYQGSLMHSLGDRCYLDESLRFSPSR